MKNALLLIVISLIVLCNSLSGTREEILSKLQQAKNPEEQMEIVKESIAKTDDIDLIRSLQDYWGSIDIASRNEYFTQQFEANPDSKVYHYLWLRVQEDNLKRHEEARKLVNKHPDFNYSYVILASLYSNYLFRDREHPTIDNKLMKKLYKKDEKVLKRWNKKFPEEDLSLYYMYNLSMWKKDYGQAEKTLLAKKEDLPDWLDQNVIFGFSMITNSTGIFKELFPVAISKLITQGMITSADSLDMYNSYYIRALFNLKNWDELDPYVDKYPALLENQGLQMLFADIYFDREMYDQAIDILNTHFENGKLNYATIAVHKKWDKMNGIKEWQELKDRAKRKWDEERPERRKEALTDKQNRVATHWELPDKDGNIIKLEDCKGSVVILDFWAPWCGPCRMVMPVLDEWVRKEMPEDVKVFSILIWDNNPQAALELFETEDYKMTLLIGTDDLVEKYGFRGIPYLTIIDKEGIIRYVEPGYSNNLAEKLTWWVEDLMEE